jgi:circadian clock protein KaiC
MERDGHTSARAVAPPTPGNSTIEPTLPKSPTGIQGLDEITGGGFPRGRPTLVCGSAGSGKTLLAMQFLARGALDFDEAGVFMSFEEPLTDLAQNVASLGYDLQALVAAKKLAVDYVRVERSEIEETGDYDLEALFVRLAYAIDSVGAKRVVLDTLESLFGGLANAGILRAELRRLFSWLKDRGVTAIITGERGGAGSLTRQGLDEYVSDCVILLDHRVHDQVSTRRLRIVKYRGTSHGTNEYPFLIDATGLSVLPVTSLSLDHTAPTERISSGIGRLDTMLGGKGYYRGSSVLVTGAAGTGKSSIAAHFVDAACRHGERCLFFAFEESPQQLIRNMRSIGIDLAVPVGRHVLRFEAARPTLVGLEQHLSTLHRAVREFKPTVVVLDPITSLLSVGEGAEVEAVLLRMVDFLKSQEITGFFTSLTRGGVPLEQSGVSISSLMDTWLLLQDLEANGERTRGLYVIKARGLAHSNQIREFVLTDHGVELLDIYVSAAGVLTGTARAAQETHERAAAFARQQDVDRKQRELTRERAILAARMAALQADIETMDEELRRLPEHERQREALLDDERDVIARSRLADQPGNGAGEGAKGDRR